MPLRSRRDVRGRQGAYHNARLQSAGLCAGFLTEKFCQILVEPFCYDAACSFAAASFSVDVLHYGYSEFP